MLTKKCLHNWTVGRLRFKHERLILESNCQVKGTVLSAVVLTILFRIVSNKCCRNVLGEGMRMCTVFQGSVQVRTETSKYIVHKFLYM